MHEIASPSHLRSSLNMNNDPLTAFAIAKPIALLYELSVIQLPAFETRNEKLAKRRNYIAYLKLRNNVRNNVRLGTTRKALANRSKKELKSTGRREHGLSIWKSVPVHNELMHNAGLNNLTFTDV